VCVATLNGTVFSKSNKAHNFYNSQYDLKKYVVWCVRNIGDKSLMDRGIKMNAESAPCHICVKRLLKFGFRKMGYTNKDGHMIIIKLIDFSGYESSSQNKTSKIITI